MSGKDADDFDPTSPAAVAAILDEAERLKDERDRYGVALDQAANEGRNVLPDATDDQAAVIEAWAFRVISMAPHQPISSEDAARLYDERVSLWGEG